MTRTPQLPSSPQTTHHGSSTIQKIHQHQLSKVVVVARRCFSHELLGSSSSGHASPIAKWIASCRYLCIKFRGDAGIRPWNRIEMYNVEGVHCQSSNLWWVPDKTIGGVLTRENFPWPGQKFNPLVLLLGRYSQFGWSWAGEMPGHDWLPSRFQFNSDGWSFWESVGSVLYTVPY